MILCLCQGVSEKRVRAAIDAGAQTRADVTRKCGAGGACGGCHGAIRDLLREARAKGREAVASGPGAAEPSHGGADYTPEACRLSA